VLCLTAPFVHYSHTTVWNPNSLYLVFCTQKNALKSAQFSRYNTTFLDFFLQFYPKMSNNWGTGLTCLRPAWLYCTGQQLKASLFPCLLSSLSSLRLQSLRHGSCLSFTLVLCHSTLTPRRHLSSETLVTLFQAFAFPSRSGGMPLLALIVPQTTRFLSSMFELISHCYKNALDKCDDFSIRFCLKVITLCPKTYFPQLSISQCCRYSPILPPSPFSPALHIWLFSLDCMS
jgi:hypothetical protein